MDFLVTKPYRYAFSRMQRSLYLTVLLCDRLAHLLERLADD